MTFSVTTECNYRDGAFEVFLEFNRIQALLAAWNALLQPSSPVWAKKKSCHPENILFSGCLFDRILLLHPQHSHSVGGAVQPCPSPIPSQGMFSRTEESSSRMWRRYPNYGQPSMETGSKLSKEFTQSKTLKIWKTINISYL